jgi:hypothetical protein
VVVVVVVVVGLVLVEEVELAPVAALLAEVESLAVLEDEDPPLLDPIVPDSVVSETCLGGSTRPSSWKACAQSKRESTSWSTACTRCSCCAMKLT